jgi:hypothetical protein
VSKIFSHNTKPVRHSTRELHKRQLTPNTGIVKERQVATWGWLVEGAGDV